MTAEIQHQIDSSDVWQRAEFMLGPPHRFVLPMSTRGDRIKPGDFRVLTERPGRAAFTLESLFISKAISEVDDVALEDWHICDLSIANRSLYKMAGSLSGALFSSTEPCRVRPRGIDSDEIGILSDFVTFGCRALPWQSVTLVIAYGGPDPDGKQFFGTITGIGRDLDLRVKE